MTGREPLFIPCASRGCIELLHRYSVEIIGKKAVVIGRSNITGLPTSLLLQDNKGSHVTGDVCYEEAIVKASLLTPVPGGVGPVTISMLLCNTVEAAKRAYQWTEKSS
ncbi:putative methenyltetrahydrofolate cyclohydrolase, Methylenetetrahydrofolate dehydrogenase (NADP(+)) [Helianthus anomalus]